MKTEMGELLVGAFQQVIQRCDIVCYNQRLSGGGLSGLNEIDVLGLRFDRKTAFLCEVATHIGGLLYVDYPTTVARITAKHRHQKAFAEARLQEFPDRRYQLWSPVVPEGILTDRLNHIDPDLKLVINGRYARRVDRLRNAAGERMNDENNSAFRLMQILEHLRR